jgi:hypothetical protein
LPVASTGLLGNLESRQPRHGTDRIDADEIRRGEDAAAITFRHMDTADQRMRQRAAHKGNVLQPGEANIGHELAAAAHQPIVFLPWQPCADALSGARSACGRKLALIAHVDALPDRTDLAPTPQRLAAELALQRRIACRRADRTRAAADARR